MQLVDANKYCDRKKKEHDLECTISIVWGKAKDCFDEVHQRLLIQDNE